MHAIAPLLQALGSRRARFTYDLRGRCLVYSGIVCAYEAPLVPVGRTLLATVIDHALEHDGFVGGCRDLQTGEVHYESCRLFTDMDSALRFAQQQAQPAVFNINRDAEFRVRALLRAS